MQHGWGGGRIQHGGGGGRIQRETRGNDNSTDAH